MWFAVSLTRELAPVLTALVVAGRVGAGITAEVGSMVVTEQVDALKAFAVNPIKFLVVPRFWALVIMLPVLNDFRGFNRYLRRFCDLCRKARY